MVDPKASLTKKRPVVYVDPARKLLTVDEVAAELHVSRFTIWRMRDQGRFPRAIMIGSSARWERADIDAYKEKSRSTDSGISKRRKPGPKPTEQRT